MNDLVVSTSSADQGPIHYLNVEYLFRLIYDLANGVHPAAGFGPWLAHVWSLVTVVGYGVAIVCIGVITFTVIELYKVREREKAQYAPILIAKDGEAQHARWRHIESLMGSLNPSDWRQAIIEADIYLGDVLKREGLPGDTIGDMLKAMNPAQLDTLDDAWDAHRVRNEIAHQGSEFPLSEAMARRTIAKYENVFRELGGV